VPAVDVTSAPNASTRTYFGGVALCALGTLACARMSIAPVVKVIDFGVAKALGQELTDKTLFTGSPR
jgi:hypothetical protein